MPEDPKKMGAANIPDAAEHHRLAHMLRKAGKLDDALPHFEQAVAHNPTDAIFRADLAQTLLALGQIKAALPHARQATILRPDMPMLYLILGDALRRAEQFDEARIAYEGAVRLQPMLARAHANLGLLLRDRKQIAEAFAPLRQALALEPNNPMFCRYLAELSGEWEDYPESIRFWRRAVAIQPLDPALQRGLAGALLDGGDIEAAKQQVELAVQMQPDVYEAQMLLARYHQQFGEPERAESAYRKAIEQQPELPQALCQLAKLLGKSLPKSDLDLIKSRLTVSDLPLAPRSELLFALAGVLDTRGDYHGATLASREANSLRCQQANQRDPYLPERHQVFVDGAIQVFKQELFSHLAEAGNATQRPMFIIGMPRSGTTLVEQILASHPRVHGAGELRLAYQSFMAIPSALGRTGDPLDCAASLDGAAIRKLADQHLAWLSVIDGGKAERIIDKMPGNYQYLGLLAAMFPRAVFIHSRRDPRDVAVSCWFTSFRWLPWTSDCSHLRARLAQYDRLMEHWRRVLPGRLIEVDYEVLVQDLEGTARRLVAACGLTWDPICLDSHRSRRPIRTASVHQVRQPVYQHSVGRWKNYQDKLPELFQLENGS